MNTHLEIFESVLEQTAGQLGDITKPVMSLYYEKFPEAKASFEEHGLDNVGQLEASMIETVVYSLMTWFERPEEIEITLLTTVPHHLNILNIPMSLFYGLVDCTLDVIESVAAKNSQQLAVCQDLRKELTDCIEGCI